MHIPDLFIVGSETLPGLAFGWSATQAYFRTCCCHFVCPFLCFDYLERVLGGAKNVVRLPPAIEILPETHCGCRPHGIWGAASSVPSRCRLRARLRRVTGRPAEWSLPLTTRVTHHRESASFHSSGRFSFEPASQSRFPFR